MNIDTIIRTFEQPDETREFEKGRLELVISVHLLGADSYARK